MNYCTIIILLSIITYIYAGCDNSCSGHGICGPKGVCKCYDNWGVGLSYDSGDCSQRVCPFEFAWVDSPDKIGQHHKYVECSAKGICNRDTGECECFPGYEGKACARTTCPNECSGHGQCVYMDEQPYKSVVGDYNNFNFAVKYMAELVKTATVTGALSSSILATSLFLDNLVPNNRIALDGIIYYIKSKTVTRTLSASAIATSGQITSSSNGLQLGDFITITGSGIPVCSSVDTICANKVFIVNNIISGNVFTVGDLTATNTAKPITGAISSTVTITYIASFKVSTSPMGNDYLFSTGTTFTTPSAVALESKEDIGLVASVTGTYDNGDGHSTSGGVVKSTINHGLNIGDYVYFSGTETRTVNLRQDQNYVGIATGPISSTTKTINTGIITSTDKALKNGDKVDTDGTTVLSVALTGTKETAVTLSNGAIAEFTLATGNDGSARVIDTGDDGIATVTIKTGDIGTSKTLATGNTAVTVSLTGTSTLAHTTGLFTTADDHGLLVGDYVKFTSYDGLDTNPAVDDTFEIGLLYKVLTADTTNPFTFTLALASAATVAIVPDTDVTFTTTQIKQQYYLSAADGFLTAVNHGLAIGNYIKFGDYGAIKTTDESIDSTFNTNTLYKVINVQGDKFQLSVAATPTTPVKPGTDVIIGSGKTFIQRYVVDDINGIFTSDGAHTLLDGDYVRFNACNSPLSDTYSTSALYYFIYVSPNTFKLALASNTNTPVKPAFGFDTVAVTNTLKKVKVVRTDGVFTTTANHNLIVGDVVKFDAWSSLLCTVFSAGTKYFVKSKTDITFTLSATSPTGATLVPTAGAFYMAAADVVFKQFVVKPDGVFTTTANHGLAAGDFIDFKTWGSTTDTTTYKDKTAVSSYYVLTVTDKTFTISATVGGGLLAPASSTILDIAATDKIEKLYSVKSVDGVFTKATHGLIDGNYIKLTGWVGAGIDAAAIYRVKKLTDDTFSITTTTDTVTTVKPTANVLVLSSFTFVKYNSPALSVDGIFTTGGNHNLYANDYIMFKDATGGANNYNDDATGITKNTIYQVLAVPTTTTFTLKTAGSTNTQRKPSSDIDEPTGVVVKQYVVRKTGSSAQYASGEIELVKDAGADFAVGDYVRLVGWSTSEPGISADTLYRIKSITGDVITLQVSATVNTLLVPTNDVYNLGSIKLQKVYVVLAADGKIPLPASHDFVDDDYVILQNFPSSLIQNNVYYQIKISTANGKDYAQVALPSAKTTYIKPASDIVYLAGTISKAYTVLKTNGEITTSSTHGLAVGDFITISGLSAYGIAQNPSTATAQDNVYKVKTVSAADKTFTVQLWSDGTAAVVKPTTTDVNNFVNAGIYKFTTRIASADGVITTSAVHGLVVGDFVKLSNILFHATAQKDLENNVVYQVQSVPSTTQFTVSKVGDSIATSALTVVKPTMDIAAVYSPIVTEVPYSVPYDSKYFLNVNKLFVVSSIDDPYTVHVGAYAHPGSYTTSLEGRIDKTGTAAGKISTKSPHKLVVGDHITFSNIPYDANIKNNIEYVVKTVENDRMITISTTTALTQLDPVNDLVLTDGLSTVTKVLTSINFGQLPINPVTMKRVFKVGSLSPNGIFDVVDPSSLDQSVYIDKKYWDAKKTRTCVCDPEYGSIDCSARMCQYGNDVMDSKRDKTVAVKNHVQLVTLKANKDWGDFTVDRAAGNIGKTIALTFKSKLNETFSTIPIPIPVFPYTSNINSQSAAATAGDVRAFELNVEWALKGLPNHVIDGVKVHVTKPVDTTNYILSAPSYSYSTLFMVDSPASTTPLSDTATPLDETGFAPIFQFSVEFTGNNVQGTQHYLTVEAAKCANGCTPKIASGVKLSADSASVTVVTKPTFSVGDDNDMEADYNSYECGRRGKCDYKTGLCSCFSGYTGLSCNVVSALI